MPDELKPVPTGAGVAQQNTPPTPPTGGGGEPTTPPPPLFDSGPLNPPPDPTSPPPPPTPDTFDASIIPPVISTPPSPPRSRAKIVGSILAFVILVIGIPAGIFLVSQTQELREKAKGEAEGAACTGVKFYQAGTTASVSRVEATKQYTVEVLMTNTSETAWTPDQYVLTFPITPLVPPATGHAPSTPNDDKSVSGWTIQVPLRLTTDIAPGGTASLGTTVTAPTNPGIYTFYWRMMKIGVGVFGGQCTQDITVYEPTSPSTPSDTTPSSGGGGGGGGGSGSRDRGGQITAECRNIKFYDSTGKTLAQADLTQLKPGDTVKIGVGGTTTSGTINKARFKINGTFYPDSTGTTTKDSETSEFYINYKIPEDIKTFTINAELHHTNPDVGDGGWF